MWSLTQSICWLETVAAQVLAECREAGGNSTHLKSLWAHVFTVKSYQTLSTLASFRKESLCLFRSPFLLLEVRMVGGVSFHASGHWESLCVLLPPSPTPDPLFFTLKVWVVYLDTHPLSSLVLTDVQNSELPNVNLEPTGLWAEGTFFPQGISCGIL